MSVKSGGVGGGRVRIGVGARWRWCGRPTRMVEIKETLLVEAVEVMPLPYWMLADAASPRWRWVSESNVRDQKVKPKRWDPAYFSSCEAKCVG